MLDMTCNTATEDFQLARLGIKVEDCSSALQRRFAQKGDTVDPKLQRSLKEKWIRSWRPSLMNEGYLSKRWFNGALVLAVN